MSSCQHGLSRGRPTRASASSPKEAVQLRWSLFSAYLEPWHEQREPDGERGLALEAAARS